MKLYMDFGHLLAFGPPVELSEMAMEIDVVSCMRPYKMKNPPRSYTGLAYMPLRLPQEVYTLCCRLQLQVAALRGTENINL